MDVMNAYYLGDVNKGASSARTLSDSSCSMFAGGGFRVQGKTKQKQHESQLAS